MKIHVDRASTTSMAATLILAVMATGPAAGSTPEERGRAVALEADRQDRGWRDDRATMRMVLRNRAGSESVRRLRRHAREVPEEGYGDRSLVIFDSPRDIDGTALLSHTRILQPDDQWLYLPSLKRVKRISSRNKSGPFVGSEFAFEDLLSQEVGKYDYRWLRVESCGELRCHVVERVPLYENSGYERQVVWWDDAEYRVQRIEFFDRKNAHLKTLVYEGYAEYADAYWRPARMRMENHQSGKTTDLLFEEWEIDTGERESLFSPTRLKRVK